MSVAVIKSVKAARARSVALSRSLLKETTNTGAADEQEVI
jgi:hypothetical protein